MRIEHSGEELKRQYERSQILSDMTLKIRQSLALNDILKTAVTEVKQFLQSDRVMIFELKPEGSGTVVQEAVSDGWTKTWGHDLFDPCFKNNFVERYRHGRISTIEDVDRAALRSCHADFLKQFEVRANLVVPILQQHSLWGLLIAHQCDRPRHWTLMEIELLRQIADQIGIALSQSQRLNQLEQQVAARTAELSAANVQLQQEIEERRQIERSLRQSEERFRTLVDNLPGAIYRCLFDSDRTMLFLSSAITEISGYPAADFVQNQVRAFRSIVHTDDRTRVRQEIGAAIAQKRPYSITYRIVNAQGDLHWVAENGQGIFSHHDEHSDDSSAELLYLDGVILDITKQRQVEQALQASAAQLRLTTDTLPALIAYVDNQQHYQFVNKTYELWYGIAKKDIIGNAICDLLDEDLYQQVRPAIEQALSGKRTTIETKIKFKDKVTRYVSETYIPNINAEGEVNGFFFLGSDVSEQKEMAQMKDEFISVVSHELRTPLTSIYGSLKLLKTTTESSFSEDDLGILNIAISSSERLIRLVNDILDLERIESGKVTLVKQCCSAGDLLYQAAETMTAQAEEQGVTIAIAPASIKLWADPDHIHQTLTNLLSNAIRFSPPGATIWLNAQAHAHEVLFSVKDQGRGIPTDKLETIFGRFQQVDASDSREKEGTGLGLAICHDIVSEHGGRIWAESVLGQGSTFYFTLPIELKRL